MKKLVLLTLAICTAYSTSSLQAVRTYTPYDDQGKPMVDINKKTMCKELIGRLHQVAETLEAHLDSYGPCLKEKTRKRINRIVDQVHNLAEDIQNKLKKTQEEEVAPV